MPLPEIYPLLLNPNEDSYKMARARLLLRYLLGDPDAAAVLISLPRLYHFLTNFDYYVVVYGAERATRKLMDMLKVVRREPADRVETLLELYKQDDMFLEPLVDALLELKVQVAKEGAPENLLRIIDETISAGTGQKKASFIRKVQIVLSYIKLFREEGAEQVSRAIAILLGQPQSAPTPVPAVPPPSMSRPGDVDLTDTLRFVADTNLLGKYATKEDILAFFAGDAVKASTVIKRLRSGSEPKLVYDKKAGGYLISPTGLKELYDAGILTESDAKKLISFVRTNPLVSKLIEKGVYKDPEVLLGFRQEEGDEDESEEEG